MMDYFDIFDLCIYLLDEKRESTDSISAITIAGTCNAGSFTIFQNIPLSGGFHVNLTPLICICGGTAVGGIVVFIVDILSTAIRHGCG